VSGFLSDNSGATAIEYALIAGFISILIVGGATLIGTHLNTIFSNVASGLH
jgi:pilus assembly protein Flp/PilA